MECPRIKVSPISRVLLLYLLFLEMFLSLAHGNTKAKGKNNVNFQSESRLEFVVI